MQLVKMFNVAPTLQYNPSNKRACQQHICKKIDVVMLQQK